MLLQEKCGIFTPLPGIARPTPPKQPGEAGLARLPNFGDPCAYLYRFRFLVSGFRLGKPEIPISYKLYLVHLKENQVLGRGAPLH